MFALVVGFFVGVLITTIAPVERGSSAPARDPAPQRSPASSSQAPAGDGAPPAARSGDAATADPGSAVGPTRADTAAGDADAPQPEQAEVTGEQPAASTPRDQRPAEAGASDRPEQAGTSEDVRGVDSDSVKIGVAVANHGPLAYASPAFDNGDPEEQWRAMVDSWRERGLDVIHGRRLEFVYRSYDILDADSEREACKGFVRDDKVFMVVGINYFPNGSRCVTAEERTPLLTADSQAEEALAQGDPFLFSLAMSNNRAVRNMVHFGHDRGILKGATIGVYHLNDPAQTRLVEEDLEPELNGLGYEVAVTHTTDQALGGPQDAVAVQRFRAEGVDLALLFTSKTGFMQQADAQDYHPTYLESDFLVGTSDETTSTYPPEQFDGTFALTGRREGEVNAGMPLDEKREYCLDNFERQTGRRADDDTFEWDNVLIVCDEGETLRRVLEAAGPALTRQSWVAGFETIEDLHLRKFLPATYGPGKHHGTDVWRPLQWRAECECWHVVGPVQELYAP